LKKRVLYIQYTNPAGYPPLQHSSRMFARAGWEVLFLGTRSAATNVLVFPSDPAITVRQMHTGSDGLRVRLRFLHFSLWAFAWCCRWRPHVVYASDLYAALPALLVRPFVKTVIYHEHDTPQRGDGRLSVFQRFCLWTRSMIARRVDFCILPNRARARVFQQDTRTARPVHVVWNCPSVEEVDGPRRNNARVRVLYHGSIVPDRLPLTVIDALPRISRPVTLCVAGYETQGAAGYLSRLRQRAREVGCADSFEYVGAKPRRELMAFCGTCDIGLSLMPMRSNDANMTAMTGASNKAFDYLARGLPLLVSDLPEWNDLFVDGGYALACDPEDPASVARAIQWYVDHAEERRAMGEAGRRRIETEWNYEAGFRRVLEECEARL
jgi:glycosyltransferase involved in cell wall biosynthesis